MTALRKRFIEDLRLRNRSPKTIGAYVSHAARFAQHFGLSPDQLGADQIRQYQLHLIDRKLSFSTVNQCVCALRFLYGVTLDRPDRIYRIPYGRGPKKLPVVLDRQEVLELLACVENRRNRTVLTMIYATGLRVSEAVHVSVADIDSRRMQLVVARGKGNKQRVVPLTAALLDHLRQWWVEHRDPRWLFPTNRPVQPVVPVSSDTISKACRAAALKAGLKKPATPHSLRHTFATELLEANVDLLAIQKILGHASLQTAVRYTHVRRNHLRKAGEALDLLPLKQLLGERARDPGYTDTARASAK